MPGATGTAAEIATTAAGAGSQANCVPESLQNVASCAGNSATANCSRSRASTAAILASSALAVAQNTACASGCAKKLYSLVMSRSRASCQLAQYCAL